MKVWIISYAGKDCIPELIDAQVKQPYPQLICKLDGKKFYVEFENRSDHYASLNGSAARVEIVSWNRSVRQKGMAVCKLVAADQTSA